VPAIERDILTTVENAMRFRAARQGVLAENVANADTPGYRRGDLEFDARLAEATLARTRGTTTAGNAPPGPAGARYVLDESPARPDGNNVIADREVVLLTRNAGAFVQQAEVLSRLLALRRTAITGGR
jgi:flagellar basal-body rod protein FlgB